MTQIQTAAQLGFAIPPTLVTSIGPQARAFARQFGKVLYKPLTAAFLHTDNEVRLVYATLIGPDELDDTSIALTPCQFQAFKWGWLEDETGVPIADAIARRLTGETA